MPSLVSSDHLLTQCVHLGGLDRGTSAVLAQYLLPPHPAEPLVSSIRFVDKYSIDPPTTYITKDFLKLVNERTGVLEYRQANLTNPSECPVSSRVSLEIHPCVITVPTLADVHPSKPS